MAKRTVNVCDVHANTGDIVPATVHSRLQLDSDTQELDLCEVHAAELRAAISGFLSTPVLPRRRSAAKSARGRATKATGSRGRRTTATRKQAPRKRTTAARGSARSSAAFTEGVRKWAREQGMDVKERGRLPRSVVEQYAATHGDSAG